MEPPRHLHRPCSWRKLRARAALTQQPRRVGPAPPGPARAVRHVRANRRPGASASEALRTLETSLLYCGGMHGRRGLHGVPRHRPKSESSAWRGPQREHPHGSAAGAGCIVGCVGYCRLCYGGMARQRGIYRMLYHGAASVSEQGLSGALGCLGCSSAPYTGTHLQGLSGAPGCLGCSSAPYTGTHLQGLSGALGCLGCSCGRPSRGGICKRAGHQRRARLLVRAASAARAQLSVRVCRRDCGLEISKREIQGRDAYKGETHTRARRVLLVSSIGTHTSAHTPRHTVRAYDLPLECHSDSCTSLIKYNECTSMSVLHCT
jgi:hypothetical protein